MRLADFANNRRLEEERRARDAVLGLLTEEELVSVGRARPAGEGEEHLGLDPDGAISVSSGLSGTRCHLLAKASVGQRTWDRIVARVVGGRSASGRS
jgi:hypothetical protein